jgi:hypothetical protein
MQHPLSPGIAKTSKLTIPALSVETHIDRIFYARVLKALEQSSKTSGIQLDTARMWQRASKRVFSLGIQCRRLPAEMRMICFLHSLAKNLIRILQSVASIPSPLPSKYNRDLLWSMGSISSKHIKGGRIIGEQEQTTVLRKTHVLLYKEKTHDGCI